jgi:hypothetical protein
MVKFYVEIYAWSWIRSERQWGQSGSHLWAGWMTVSMWMWLHLMTAVCVVVALPSTDFSLIRVLKNPISLGAGLVIVAAIAWLLVVRSGRATILVRELQTGSGEGRRRCESRLRRRELLSFALFLTALVCLGLSRDMSRAKRGAAPNATSTVTTAMVPELRR